MTAQLGPDGITNLPGGNYRRVITGVVTTSDNDYIRFGRCRNGLGYSGSMGFAISGTANSTVAGFTGIAMSNHSRDGHINITSKTSYSGIKIKMVSDGNQNFDLYVAVATYSTYNISMYYQIWEINGITEGHSDAGTAYSTCYLETTYSTGHFSSSSMTSGLGPTAY